MMTDRNRVESSSDHPTANAEGDKTNSRRTNPRNKKSTSLAGRKKDNVNLERATLSSTELYQLAVREQIELSRDEKDRVSPDYLFVLAITNRIALSQHDKDRLRPLHVAHLAVTNRTELSQEDKARLPTDLLFRLFVQGFAGLTGGEMARLSMAQLQHVKELERAHAETLVLL